MQVYIGWITLFIWGEERTDILATAQFDRDDARQELDKLVEQIKAAGIPHLYKVEHYVTPLGVGENLETLETVFDLIGYEPEEV